MSWLDRVQEEYIQLRERLKALSVFMDGDDFTSLAPADRLDLHEQSDYMSSYLTVLGRRLSRHAVPR